MVNGKCMVNGKFKVSRSCVSKQVFVMFCKVAFNGIMKNHEIIIHCFGQCFEN